jgi:hypothetical protein
MIDLQRAFLVLGAVFLVVFTAVGLWVLVAQARYWWWRSQHSLRWGKRS